METGEGEGFYNTTKIGDKEEGEGENHFVFSQGSRAAMPRFEMLGGKKGRGHFV